MARPLYEALGAAWLILAVVMWIMSMSKHGMDADIAWIKGGVMFCLGQVFLIRAKVG